MNLDVEMTLGLLAQFVVIVAGISAGFYGIKKWVKATAVDPVMDQVGPNGSKNQNTTRHVIESIHADNLAIKQGQVEIIDRLDAAESRATRNYDLAVAAQTLAQHTSDRLDRWLAERGGKQNG